MRLGDVLAETEDQPAEDPPRPRRRFGLWTALWLLLGLGALSWAHGPVVLFPEGDEVLLLYSPEGWGLLGPPVRTIVDKPFVIRLPLLQRVARIDTAARTVEVDARVSADGVSIRLAGGRVRHRVRPADADRVVRRLGTDPAVRDRLVLDLTRSAWSESVGALGVDQLADPAQIGARLDAAAELLADRAAEFGIETEVESRPAAEVDPALARLLAQVGEVEAQVDERKTGAGQRDARQREDRLNLERRHRQEQAAARIELQGRLAVAEAAAARARVEAERAYAARLAAARVEQKTLVAAARVIAGEGQLEAETIRAGVAALGQSGPRVLDHIIATRILPQLANVRTGTPALPPVFENAPSLPVRPLPATPPAALDPAAGAPAAEAPVDGQPAVEAPAVEGAEAEAAAEPKAAGAPSAEEPRP